MENSGEKDMILISQTGIRNKGLTLIELIVVIFIISLSTAIVIPSLWHTNKEEIISDAKRLSNTLRYVHNEAVSRREAHSFNLNLDQDTYGFSSTSEKRSFRMNGTGGFKDVMIPSLGTLTEGEVSIAFGLLGSEEPLIIHIFYEDLEYTIIFNNITGRSHVIEGYSIDGNS